MLSYQHAYHAGNPADVHKHFVLAELLRLLTKKDRGISYLETHAGRGLYDLCSAEAAKTGEAAEGIERLTPPPTAAISAALSGIRADYGEAAYPGSPLIATQLLRPQDRIVLMERHPQEAPALKRAVRTSQAEVHMRDGYEGAIAVSPMTPRRGLILIDPSYEVKTEYRKAGTLAAKLHQRWPEAAVMVWYPLLEAHRHKDLIEAMQPSLVDEVQFELKGGKGMTGSGLAFLGEPFGTDVALQEAFEAAQPILGKR